MSGPPPRARDQDGVVERFNGSLEYERLYRDEIGDVLDLDARIRAFIELYNAVRPHEALGFAPPLARYLEPPSVRRSRRKSAHPLLRSGSGCL